MIVGIVKNGFRRDGNGRLTGKITDAFPNFGEGIPAVGGQMLGNSQRAQKRRIMGGDFRRPLIAVELSEQSRHAFDHLRI